MVRYCPLYYAQSLCDSVLGDAEAVHTVYLEVDVQLCRGLEIGYVGVHCSSRATDCLSRGKGTDLFVLLSSALYSRLLFLYPIPNILE